MKFEVAEKDIKDFLIIVKDSGLDIKTIHQRECYTDGCTTGVSPHEWNGFDLWCGPCHAKARGRDKETKDQKRERISRDFQKRVFRDGRAGKIK